MTLRTSLLGSWMLATALVACGDDGTDGAATSTSGGGGAGSGGDATASTATATTSSTSDASSSVASSTAGSGGAGSGGETGSGGAGGETGSGGAGGETGSGGAGGETGSGGMGGAPACGTPPECAAEWEQNASDRYDDLVGSDPDDLYDFLFAVPKGGDLHNHLTGSVYAEEFIDWGRAQGGFCVDATLRAITAGSCTGQNQALPASGDPLYLDIVRAWSMLDFVSSPAENGHDHFFATFGKFGAVAGQRRNQNLADIAMRAASENQVYIETMFNLGRNVGELTDDNWVGTLNVGDLQAAYDLAVNDPAFATELQQDVNIVDQAYAQYRTELGCAGGSPPAACDVGMRFIAQVSRTGPRATVFGQLISAFEMASRTPYLVGVNLSSPEDDTTSLNAYSLHMQMLDFLHDIYVENGTSPLHITLHAGELTDDFAPPAALLFHVRDAVLIGHAERIGHGLDILGETNAQDTLDEMRDRGVLVETCLSSNTQILEVDGPEHPLAAYIENGVPVAFATDDQGVSRSSMAGEYMRAALDQEVSYRQLKKMARASLQHAFLPGAGLWTSLDDGEVVDDCAPTDTMGLGQSPNAACADFLGASEKAQAQWELERRFRVFESQQ